MNRTAAPVSEHQTPLPPCLVRHLESAVHRHLLRSSIALVSTLGIIGAYAAAGLDRWRVVLHPFKPSVVIRSLPILPPDRAKSVLVRDMIGALIAAR